MTVPKSNWPVIIIHMNVLSELLFLKKKQNNLKFDIVNFLLQNKYCYNQFIFEKYLTSIVFISWQFNFIYTQ